MNNISIVRGSIDVLIEVNIKHIYHGLTVDTGRGLTGLVYNTASLTAYYYRGDDASATAISLVTMTLGTWASGGFVVIDGTNMPGLYQIGVPNTALASGVDAVTIILRGAIDMKEIVLEIDLVDEVVKYTSIKNLLRRETAMPKKAPERFAVLNVR